jgi:hypothetical protein
MNRDGPTAPTAIPGPLGITYQLTEKAKVIAACLEHQFTSHGLYDENHERQVETTVQALLASVDGNSLGKVRLCDIQKLANLLNCERLVDLMVFQTNALCIFREDH